MMHKVPLKPVLRTRKEYLLAARHLKKQVKRASNTAPHSIPGLEMRYRALRHQHGLPPPTSLDLFTL